MAKLHEKLIEWTGEIVILIGIGIVAGWWNTSLAVESLRGDIRVMAKDVQALKDRTAPGGQDITRKEFDLVINQLHTRHGLLQDAVADNRTESKKGRDDLWARNLVPRPGE